MAEGKFARAYETLFSRYLKPIREKIVKIAAEYKCRNIIDLGCGTGEQCIMLYKQGFSVIGVDASQQMLQVAKRNSPKEIKYILADILSIAFPANFDCAIISFVLHGNELEKQKRIVEKAKSIVGKNGIVIIADYGYPEKFKGKIIEAIIKIIENLASKEHRKNYKLYVKNGGLQWILKSYSIAEHYRFYGGAIRVIVI